MSFSNMASNCWNVSFSYVERVSGSLFEGSAENAYVPLFANVQSAARHVMCARQDAGECNIRCAQSSSTSGHAVHAPPPVKKTPLRPSVPGRTTRDHKSCGKISATRYNIILVAVRGGEEETHTRNVWFKYDK